QVTAEKRLPHRLRASGGRHGGRQDNATVRDSTTPTMESKVQVEAASTLKPTLGAGEDDAELKPGVAGLLRRRRRCKRLENAMQNSTAMGECWRAPVDDVPGDASDWRMRCRTRCGRLLMNWVLQGLRKKIKKVKKKN
ncbi:hypothetical protein U1Q18_007045, partial [Sarracenia purpurea var. burkii]